MDENIEVAKETKSPKKILIVLGVVAVVMVALAWFVIRGGMPGVPIEPPEEATTSQPAPEEEKAQSSEEVDAFVRQAIDNQDPSYCEAIQNEKTKQWCKEQAIIAEAMVALDSTICNKLEKEGSRAVCRDSVIVNKAVVDKNPSLCDTLVDKTRVEPCKKDASPL